MESEAMAEEEQEELGEDADEEAKVHSADQKEKDMLEDAVEKVEVLVRHAIQERSVVLICVASTANMRQVKDAVAVKLGRSEIAKQGFLVRRTDSDFACLEDTYPLGTCRNLLMMGIEDLEPRQKEAAASSLSPGREHIINLDQVDDK